MSTIRKKGTRKNTTGSREHESGNESLLTRQVSIGFKEHVLEDITSAVLPPTRDDDDSGAAEAKTHQPSFCEWWNVASATGGREAVGGMRRHAASSWWRSPWESATWRSVKPIGSSVSRAWLDHGEPGGRSPLPAPKLA
jgi:hypothetical protein